MQKSRIVRIALMASSLALIADSAHADVLSGDWLGPPRPYASARPSPVTPVFHEDATVTPTVSDTDPTIEVMLLPDGPNGPPPIASVPEPSTWAMMILGFFGVGAMAYRRRKVALAT
jgi:hypothetical protein